MLEVTYLTEKIKASREESSMHGTVDTTEAARPQTDASVLRKEEQRVIPDHARDTFISDDFDCPQDNYLNIEELKSETMDLRL